MKARVQPAASPMSVRVAGFVIAAAAVTVAGCATAPAAGPAGAQTAAAPSPIDPWENWNRKVYSFNDAIDRAVLKPVAETYRDVVPKLVRTGVDNVLGNIYDVWSTANQFLQGKVQTGFEMGMRVLSNTVFGLGGLLDPATEMGLTRRSEDFGQTLGRWGFPSGPFVVLPLLGPSTVRDAAGLLLDRQASPAALPETTAGTYAVTGIELVNVRANLLSAGALLDQVALDRYAFVRDAYLASRRDALYDGAPPLDAFDYGADPVPPSTPSAPAASASAPAK